MGARCPQSFRRIETSPFAVHPTFVGFGPYPLQGHEQAMHEDPRRKYSSIESCTPDMALTNGSYRGAVAAAESKRLGRHGVRGGGRSSIIQRRGTYHRVHFIRASLKFFWIISENDPFERFSYHVDYG